MISGGAFFLHTYIVYIVHISPEFIGVLQAMNYSTIMLVRSLRQIEAHYLGETKVYGAVYI